MPSKCFEEPFDKGSCDDKLLKWSYNDQWKGCSPFIFGGCGGNANNFNTQEECLQGETSGTGWLESWLLAPGRFSDEYFPDGHICPAMVSKANKFL